VNALKYLSLLITGVDIKFKGHVFSKFIQINDIPELKNIQLNDSSVIIGSEVTLAALESFCNSQTSKYIVSNPLH